MYAIVEFATSADGKTSNTEISVVPSQWLVKNEKKCYWPKGSHVSLIELVVKLAPYKKSWVKYPVYKVHCKKDEYNVAEFTLASLLDEAANGSDISIVSTKSLGRKVIQSDDSTSSESELETETSLNRTVISSAQQPNLPQSVSVLETVATPVSLHQQLQTPSATTSSATLLQLPVSLHQQLQTPIATTSQNASLPNNCANLTTMDLPEDWLTMPLNENASIASSSDVQQLLNEQKYIVQTLTRLIANSEQQSLLINELVRHNRTATQSTIAPENAPTLPFTNNEDFVSFDSLIKTDANLRSYMIHRLAAVGGSGIDSLTRRILKFLFTNNVAMLYNWKGRDKLSFEKTNIMAVITEAAKLNFSKSEKSDLTVANTVKDWLKYAKARDSKKRRLD